MAAAEASLEQASTCTPSVTCRARLHHHVQQVRHRRALVAADIGDALTCSSAFVIRGDAFAWKVSPAPSCSWRSAANWTIHPAPGLSGSLSPGPTLGMAAIRPCNELNEYDLPRAYPRTRPQSASTSSPACMLGNVSRAADALGLSQPAVSHALTRACGWPCATCCLSRGTAAW